ncbi:MAG: alpha-1,4-glucan--maltose-1-phosphate maltosyltransferase [Gemmatimonadota bacterium]
MPEKSKIDKSSSPRLSAVRPNRSRVIIEGVEPEIDCGRFPIKRTVGDEVIVEADVFVDGHEALSCALLHRRKGATRWAETLMTALVNDRWLASFEVTELGRYEYTLVAWHDPYKGWRRDLEKRIEAEQDIAVDLLIGAQLVEAAAERAKRNDRKLLELAAAKLREQTEESRLVALDDRLADAMTLYADREHETGYDRVLEVVVDPERARFSTWYELFPRSAGDGERHGTFRDVERWLPHIAALGFDVLYFPPIHPIGTTFRKGRNNALTPEPDDVGSPWAIGAGRGGHKDIHRELGTLQDFKRLLQRAQDFGIAVALDIAFQVSPDHPYVKEHETWFKHRPDGSIQYAENPPKKYQDIYPFDFGTEDVRGLWGELRSVFEYWAQQGVRIFRVDNPHTKPFAFWQWCIASLKAAYPDLIFLSEAFTRPKVMYRLAKHGFTQSYTYFAWRTHKTELTEYFTELTTYPVREFFRPNLWPNTPDILTGQVQTGGRPVFMQRIALAATLGASYGIYGPAYEHMDHVPLKPGSEEYLHSEKYQLRSWDLNAPDSLAPYIAKLNRARKENPALQRDDTLRFHAIENPNIIAYSKTAPANIVLAVVNLDAQWTQSGWVHVPIQDFGIAADELYSVRDLLTDDEYSWKGEWNYVELNPQTRPVHLFRIERSNA